MPPQQLFPSGGFMTFTLHGPRFSAGPFFLPKFLAGADQSARPVSAETGCHSCPTMAPPT
ncbi:hypothetical protein C6558_23900 [Ensifer sp. NM-2]|nr:hypothetical protein [Ensifer canadensis]PSS62209.1 hypothetical protein C6558_23900 [Ensifer sp. NM-2]